jgi:flagellar biosynthesis regulator FlaF
MRAWVIAIALMSVVAPAWADDWVAYKSKTGGVAASFPGGPTESTKDVDGNTLHLASYSDLGGAQFVLLWADRSKTAAKETTKQMFDDAQAPMANKAKVVSAKDFTYRGLPARDVDLLSPDNQSGAKLRMVIKKQRIYMLLATVVTPADVKKFIDSLRIN